MTNPTLLTGDTTWAGWDVDTLLDEILRPFGLTNDTTTDRVAASTDEKALARDALRLSSTYLNSKYPSVWARRRYSVTWTATDHSIVLPAGVKFIERVYYGGRPLDSITMEDRTRYAQNDEQTGDWKTSSEKPDYYYVSGVCDNDSAGGDWRMVLRLVNTPGTAYDTETLLVDYIARSPDFASGDDANQVEFDPLYHDWLVNRAVEIMAAKFGAARSLHDEAYAERLKVEDSIFDFLDGTGEFPDRVRWAYPPLSDHQRR